MVSCSRGVYTPQILHMMAFRGQLLQATVSTLLLLVVVVDLVNAQSLELVFTQRLSVNRIKLQCRQRMNLSPVTNPQLWVERSDLRRQPVNSESPQDGIIIFEITQDIEGSYSCSNNNNIYSNELDLVAYPQPNLNIPLSYTFEAGQPAMATINCRIMPGKLSQYYSVIWRKGSVVLSTDPLTPKYRLNNNFSLTINNIELSDHSNYSCTVTINDPQMTGSVRNRVYDQQLLGVITVKVYERPTIVIPPRPATVVVRRGHQVSVNFSCSAMGTPTPTISWFLNERNITQLDDSRLRELSSTAGATVSGQLTISELNAEDCGTVKCIVAVSVQTMRGVRNFRSFSQATLSVLTADFEPEVVITTGGDVQFHLTLPAAIPESLRLRIHFVAEDNLRNVQPRTSNGAFTNLTRITYELQNSRVPLQRFKVQLALMVGNMIGPFVPADLEFATVYDLNVPTDDCIGYKTILAIVCPIVGAALIAVIAIELTLSCLIWKLKKMKGRNKQKTATGFRECADGLYDKAGEPGLNPVVRDRMLEEAAKDKQHARTVADNGGLEGEEATTEPTLGSTSDNQHTITQL